MVKIFIRANFQINANTALTAAQPSAGSRSARRENTPRKYSGSGCAAAAAA